MESRSISDLQVLILEDNSLLRDLMNELTLGIGFAQSHSAASLEEAKRIVCELQPDILIADWLIKPDDATAEAVLTCCDTVKTKILIVSGYSEDSFVTTLKRLGADLVLKKPFGTRDFVYAVLKLCVHLNDEETQTLDKLSTEVDLDKIIELNCSKNGTQMRGIEATSCSM